MTTSHKNNAISIALLIAIFSPMFVHLISNINSGIEGPDLIYKIIYAPIVLWIIWAAPQGRLYYEFFKEDTEQRKPSISTSKKTSIAKTTLQWLNDNTMLATAAIAAWLVVALVFDSTLMIWLLVSVMALIPILSTFE